MKKTNLLLIFLFVFISVSAYSEVDPDYWDFMNVRKREKRYISIFKVDPDISANFILAYPTKTMAENLHLGKGMNLRICAERNRIRLGIELGWIYFMGKEIDLFWVQHNISIMNFIMNPIVQKNISTNYFTMNPLLLRLGYNLHFYKALSIIPNFSIGASLDRLKYLKIRDISPIGNVITAAKFKVNLHPIVRAGLDLRIRFSEQTDFNFSMNYKAIVEFPGSLRGIALYNMIIVDTGFLIRL